MLRFFEICFGLSISFFEQNWCHWSKIGAIGVDTNVLEMFYKVLHSSIMNLLFVYFLLPIGGNPSKVDFWGPVITKVKKRLSTWKGKIYHLLVVSA